MIKYRAKRNVQLTKNNYQSIGRDINELKNKN